MTACPNCARSLCPALNGFPSREELLDCERAKSARLESELAAERLARNCGAGYNEHRERDLCRTQHAGGALCSECAWKAAIERVQDDVAAERARADAAESRATSEAANGAALRTALDLATGAHTNAQPDCWCMSCALLKTPPSTALARVQGLVEAARAWRQVRESGAEAGAHSDADEALIAAIDAFTGTNTGDANGS